MIHQPTLWEPPQPILAPVPTRTRGLSLEEAENACRRDQNTRARRDEMAPGAYLFWRGGRWHYHASNGAERTWIPRLIEWGARNWTIYREEVAA